MTINLSQYLGKVITYRDRNDNNITGKVFLSHNKNFPYEINNYYFNNIGVGWTASNILSIMSVESVMLDGIAHSAPNINLHHFVGQTVYVKLSSGDFYTGILYLYDESRSLYLLNGYRYKLNGELNGDGLKVSWNIVEIYGEGAYEINTKGTFDLPLKPENPKIKQAKELLNEMTEDEVAKLIKSLKC
jgi:small nuclear ribonucleoprotein (snRNP)-like protein